MSSCRATNAKPFMRTGALFAPMMGRCVTLGRSTLTQSEKQELRAGGLSSLKRHDGGAPALAR